MVMAMSHSPDPNGLADDPERLDRLTIALAELAVGADFTPIVVEGTSDWDAVALGINMLAEELAANTVSRHYLEALLDSMLDPLFVVDQDRCVTQANAAAANLLGKPTDELVGAPIDAFVMGLEPSDRWVPTTSIVAELATSPQPIPVIVSRNRLRDARRWVLVAHDLRSQLDMKRQLAEARDNAIAASNVKSAFLASMSHEIRTPINGVIGMTGMLARTHLDDRQVRMVEALEASGKLLLHVVNNVLDLSKIEAGGIELDRIAFDLGAVLEQVVDSCEVLALERGNRLAVRPVGALPGRLLGDPGRIRQIVFNLVGNALKFTHHGEVLIAVETTPLTTGRERITVRVEDSGTGIHPDAIPGLWAPFVQGKGAGDSGGTGLGLAICRQLVQLMGGRIDARSDGHSGSTFWFELELDVAPDDAAQAHPVDLAEVRLLVVDDDPDEREHVRASLALFGVEARLAATEAEAIGLLARGNCFDVALVGRSSASLVAGLEAASIKVLRSVTVRDAEAVDAHSTTVNVPRPVRPWRLANVIRDVLVKVVATSTPTVWSTTGFHDRRVLVADDNSINRMVVTEVLRGMGIASRSAGTGREAVELFRNEHFDLVLMDVRMPEMDGFTAVGEIRAFERALGRHPTPVLGLTADARDGQLRACLDAGMDDYMSKPFTIDALQERVTRLLVRSQETDASLEALLAIDALAQLAHLERELGRVGWLYDVLDELAKRATQLIADARAASTRGDFTSISAAAHSFRGATAQVGAHAVATIAGELEEGARESDRDRIADALERIGPCWQATLRAIDRWRKSR